MATYDIINHTAFHVDVLSTRSSVLRCVITVNPRSSSSDSFPITFRLPLGARVASKVTRGRWHDLAIVPDTPQRRRKMGFRGSKHGKEGDHDEKTPLVRTAPIHPPPPIKAYHKTTHSGTKILLLPSLPLDAHLSALPDSTSLGDIIIPGTHQSLALHGWPVSKCQDSGSTLDVQLQEGIRFFDIRLSVKKGLLLAYHGPWPQLIPFTDMLSAISTFLLDHPRETLILCIQQESPSSSLLFSSLVRQAMDGYMARGEWFMENRVPLLGEVRGRAVLMSRFGGSPRDGGDIPWLVPVDPETAREPEPHYYEGESFHRSDPAEEAPRIARMGWKPEQWPDSVLDGFVWHAESTPCRTQDWYEIYGFFNIPAKFNVLADHLTASAQLPPRSNLTMSFASAASIPLALPPLIANGFGFPRWGLGVRGVNTRLKDWLLDWLETIGRVRTEGRLAEKKTVLDALGMLRGIIPMDFYRNSGLVELMVAFNSIQRDACREEGKTPQ